MKLSCAAALVCLLTGAGPLMANIDTLSFTTITFPNIPDPNFPTLYLLVGGSVVPTGISNNGAITGYFPQRIGIWSRDVPGVNDFGFVDSNGSYAAFYGNYPFVIGEDGSGTPVLTYQNMSVYPTGINDSGVIVGTYPGDAFLDTFGFELSGVSPSLYGASGYPLSPIAYPNLTFGFDNTFVNGINNSGEVIGTYLDQLTGTNGGFSFNNGIYTPLSYAPLAINNLGQIVGRDSSGNIVIDTNGIIRNLGMLPFTPDGFNDSGTIAGGDYLYRNGVLTQIQLQGETGVQINAINDQGYFVGTADGSGGQIGFEASTPEPFAGLPLLAGMCGIAIQLFRNRGRHMTSRAAELHKHS